MKFEEYWSGVDKEPLRVEMKPEQQEHHVSVQRRSTFLAKLGEKNVNIKDDAPSKNLASQNSGLEEYKQEIETLTAKVEELSEQLNGSRKEVTEL